MAVLVKDFKVANAERLAKNRRERDEKVAARKAEIARLRAAAAAAAAEMADDSEDTDGDTGGGYGSDADE